MAGKKTGKVGRINTLKAFYKNPIGKSLTLMGVFTVVLMTHRWYIKPFFHRKSLRENEEMANDLYKQGQVGSRAELRH